MLELHYSAETVRYYQVARRSYDLLYILPEWDLTGKSRPENNNAPPRIFGLPPTVKFLKVSHVELFDNNLDPLDTHKLLRERFALQCPPSWTHADVDKRLAGYLKNGVCYTDHTDPPAWNQLCTAGNCLYPTGNTKHTAGELYYEVRQLQAGSLDFMRAQLVKYPLLETWATISTRGYNSRQVIPFPHCGGNSVPALMYCKAGTNWIRSSRVRMLGRDEPLPPLYFP